MKFYKVVKSDLTSAVMDGTNIGLAVQYKVGEFVHADKDLLKLGYGLFVFDNLRYAINFVSVVPNCSDKIYECQVRGIVKNPNPLKLFRSWEITREQILNGQSKRFESVLPGTVIVKSVKLLKEVK